MLTVDGWGKVVLTGTNTYSGGTTVSAGRLILTDSSAIASGTNLTIGAGGPFLVGPSPLVPLSAGETSPLALPPLTSLQFVNNGPAGGNTQLPSVPLVASESQIVVRQTVGPELSPSPKFDPATASRATSGDRLIGSSHAKRIAGDLAWLGWSTSSPESSDQHHTEDVASLAVEAVFARYGR